MMVVSGSIFKLWSYRKKYSLEPVLIQVYKLKKLTIGFAFSYVLLIIMEFVVIGFHTRAQYLAVGFIKNIFSLLLGFCLPVFFLLPILYRITYRRRYILVSFILIVCSFIQFRIQYSRSVYIAPLLVLVISQILFVRFIEFDAHTLRNRFNFNSKGLVISSIATIKLLLITLMGIFIAILSRSVRGLFVSGASIFLGCKYY